MCARSCSVTSVCMLGHVIRLSKRFLRIVRQPRLRLAPRRRRAPRSGRPFDYIWYTDLVLIWYKRFVLGNELGVWYARDTAECHDTHSFACVSTYIFDAFCSALSRLPARRIQGMDHRAHRARPRARLVRFRRTHLRMSTRTANLPYRIRYFQQNMQDSRSRRRLASIHDPDPCSRWTIELIGLCQLVYIKYQVK